MKIIIYSTTTCPYCKMLKSYLSEKNVPFSEKMIDTDDAAQQEMVKVSNGFLGVPFTVVMSDNGNMDTIIGFDKTKLDSVLKI